MHCFIFSAAHGVHGMIASSGTLTQCGTVQGVHMPLSRGELLPGRRSAGGDRAGGGHGREGAPQRDGQPGPAGAAA